MALVKNVIILGIVVTTAQLIFTNLVRYDFTANYFCGSPDGVTVCHILGINGQFPGPTIEAFIGDTLHITVRNYIQKLEIRVEPVTTVHWHGIFQNGTPFQDGPDMVTQCPIPKYHSQIYIFNLKQSGTYWWHSHVSYQYTEGMWGPLIVHNKPEVYGGQYDSEFTITLSDWYHTSGQVNTDWFLSPTSGGNEPIPFSVLMNGRGSYPCNFTKLPCNPFKQVPQIIKVQRGKRYRIRVINTSAFSRFFFSIPGHRLETIETDGVDTVKVAFDTVPIAAAQRYSFIVDMNGDKNEYWILAEVDLEMFGFGEPNINPHPEALIPLVKAKLQYVDNNGFELHGSSNPNPIPPTPETEFPGEMLLQPYDTILAPNEFNKQFILNVDQLIDSEGINRLVFNNIIYKVGKEPLLALVLKNKTLPEDANPLTTKHNEVVQIVINNHDTGGHPFHLHGHTFWVLGIGAPNASDYNSTTDKLILNGVRRDTLMMYEGSWAVIRFLTDNPGVWYFHCHINWHLQSGLAATIIEAPDVIRATISLPKETKKICKSVGVDL